MNTCEQMWPRIVLWLDGELQGDEVLLVESHCESCAQCRERVAAERRFLETLKLVGQHSRASDQLRARVKTIVQSGGAQPSANILAHVGQYVRSAPAWQFVLLFAIAAGLLVATWQSRALWRTTPVTGPSSFALMAADSHRRYLQKQLPLEVVSNFPSEISAWFAGKVPFAVKLPNYREESGQPKLYKLEGARLVGYENDYAAYVAYQMNQRPISLVVTSSAMAQPVGGEVIAARGLTFHFDSIFGYKVITWSDRGLTYALVSDFEERGLKSCVVCHQGANDQELIKTLQPIKDPPQSPSRNYSLVESLPSGGSRSIDR
jgi:anti-sigma factor RsiW